MFGNCGVMSKAGAVETVGLMIVVDSISSVGSVAGSVIMSGSVAGSVIMSGSIAGSVIMAGFAYEACVGNIVILVMKAGFGETDTDSVDRRQLCEVRQLCDWHRQFCKVIRLCGG